MEPWKGQNEHKAINVAYDHEDSPSSGVETELLIGLPVYQKGEQSLPPCNT